MNRPEPTTTKTVEESLVSTDLTPEAGYETPVVLSHATRDNDTFSRPAAGWGGNRPDGRSDPQTAWWWTDPL